MSRLKRAAHATVVVQIFAVAGMLLSLVTVPLYLQWLGQERYGVLLTGMAFGGYLMFADAGLSWASMLLISQAHGRDDRAEIAAIVRCSLSLAALSAVVVVTVVTTVFVVLSSPQSRSWIPVHEETPGLILALGVSAVATLLMSPVYGVFMGLQEMYMAALYQGAARLTGMLAGLAAAAMGAQLGMVFGANVACSAVVGSVAIVHCMHRHPWAFQRGSFWDRRQVRQQIRTGAKSFATQVGNVLSGTAPVLAISTFAGAAHVPYLSVPLTLLNAPLSLINSFNATLQPGYGEAISRDERPWIAETIRSILSLGLIFMGLLVAGFIVLADPFIQMWTHGKLAVPSLMLVSVVSIGTSGALLGIFRFALTGMNRHRISGFSELACGFLSLPACAIAVHSGGAAMVGLGALVAVLLTSGWILPSELKKTLAETQPWIERKLLLMILLAVSMSIIVGHELFQRMTSVGEALAIFTSAVAILVCYACLIWLTCQDLWKKVMLALQRKPALQIT